MVALAERLQDAGYAYASSAGNVYYAVGAFEGYGRLSGNSLDELGPGIAARSSPTSAIRPISPSGRPPARVAS